MNLVQEAFFKLYPDREFDYSAELKYSGKFKPYNARVSWRDRHLYFRLSSEWKQVDKEIVVGLIQSLLLKVLKENKKSFNVDMYHSFLRKLPEYTVRRESDTVLEGAFNELDEKYFYSSLEMPTLVFGNENRVKLAHYDLHTDTIVVSSVFKNAPLELLHYVLYHEMLHKKHTFVANGSRSSFHTAAFKRDEKMFENYSGCERKLKQFLRKKPKILQMFRFF